ncbi:MAG: gamma-glutamylcysteine synthetase [Desulfuromonas sp.]|nr:MAG: gamma-glutamylcysteine synthetase [Desulfuromonas sp.]
MSPLSPEQAAQPVENKEQLGAYLAVGARSKEHRYIGTELEKLVVDAETGEAAPYNRIEELLTRIHAAGGWEPVYENRHLIALRCDRSSITLEPGGQLELSGALCSDIHCCHGDLVHHVDDISGKAREIGLAFLGLGLQPFSPLDQIEWLPKERYRIMGPYMKRLGGYGREMMTMSAGIQVNLDFTDEQDCIEKLRLGMMLAPLLYALFANSPLLCGEPSGYLSTRGHLWGQTDPDRTGLVMALFDENASYQTYVDYALQVPMYFIVRDGRYLDLTRERFTFAQFWAEGASGHRATMADWELHLSTLFPEIRLRPQLEVRSADALPREFSFAAAALLKGLFYDPTAQSEAMRLFDVDQLQQSYRNAWQLGLKTAHAGRTLQEIGADILELAREGLQRQKASNDRGLDETIYLDVLEEVISSGTTLAERLLARWQGSRQEKLAALFDHCAIS